MPCMCRSALSKMINSFCDWNTLPEGLEIECEETGQTLMDEFQ